MITIDLALTFANAWIDAWNRHDIDLIMAHYADPPEHCSPLIVERLGLADGTIRERAALEAYFRRGLGAEPPLRFELVDVVPGVSSVALHYRNHRGRTVIEVMSLDAEHKVTRSAVHYR